jgi:hypothetical protein
MRFFTSTLFASGLLLTGNPAMAFDVPHYDSATFCKTTSALVGGNDIIISSCMNREQEVQVQMQWVLSFGVLDDAALQQCDVMSRMSAGGSYQGFVGCLMLNITQQILDGKLAVVATPKP